MESWKFWSGSAFDQPLPGAPWFPWWLYNPFIAPWEDWVLSRDLWARTMGFKHICLTEVTTMTGSRSSSLCSPFPIKLGQPWACHWFFFSPLLLILQCETQWSLLKPLPSLVVGFMILQNFSFGLCLLLWFSHWPFISATNLLFPSFEPLIWNPFKAGSYSFGFFSLFLQALRCVCLISWTLSLQLKLETCRSITDARVSWSNGLKIAQVYWQKIWLWFSECPRWGCPDLGLLFPRLLRMAWAHHPLGPTFAFSCLISPFFPFSIFEVLGDL